MADDNPRLDQQHAAEVDYDRHEPRSGLIAIISGVTLVVLVGMILGVYWLYVVAYERVEQEQYTGVPSKELEAIHAREADHLYKYAYIDKEKGVIRIPVDRAIELVAAEFAQGTVAYNTKTYPVKPEGPGGAAAPPAAPAPAPAPGAPAPAAAKPANATTPAPAAPPAASTK
jgi:hypothetical protein